MNYLKSDRIRLLKFADKFVTAEYVGWLNNSDTNRFLNVGRLPVDKNVGYTTNDKNLLFAIMYKNDPEGMDRYVGTISLHGIDWIDRKGEIGYLVGDPATWGKGVATEAIGLVVDYAFNRLGLNKVTAGVVGPNAGSCKVLEKNGFTLCGTQPQDYYLEGKYLDTHLYYKLREQHNV